MYNSRFKKSKTPGYRRYPRIFSRRTLLGVSVVVQWKQIQLVSMRMPVRSPASLSGSGIRCCHELWCRSQTWLRSTLLRLWRRPAAVALIRPLGWELPYGMNMALKSKKKRTFLKCQFIPDSLIIRFSVFEPPVLSIALY